MVQIRHDLI